MRSNYAHQDINIFSYLAVGVGFDDFLESRSWVGLLNRHSEVMKR